MAPEPQRLKRRVERGPHAEEREAANNIQEENNALKRLIGHPATKTLDQITEQFGNDMTTFAGSFPEEARFYSTVLPYLYKTIDDKLAELDRNKAEVQSLKDTLEGLEATKRPQVDQHLATADQARRELEKVSAAFKARRTTIVDDQSKLKALLVKSQKEATAREAKVKADLENANVRLQKLAQLNKQKTAKLDAVIQETFEVPDGEIRWVNQRNATVWINLGRSDSLQRQTTFSVYPPDTTNLTTSGKKASIEVTQILGPHSAEARVIEDRISDPIMPGDKIHTPVWNPGEQKQFALAGSMDIDGDGKSDQHVVRNLITMNGAVVDCYIDESGKRIGAMSVNTRYLVLGKAPDEKSKASVRAGYSRMIGEADRLGVKKISLADLLQQMGWKNQSPVIRFGRGANPADFRAKPAAGVPKVSGGNVSDAFKPRRPPTRTGTGRGGAY